MFKIISRTFWTKTFFWYHLSLFYLWHHLRHHFAIFPLFYNFFAFLRNLARFLRNDYHRYSCLKYLQGHFEKIFFENHVSFLPMTSFVTSFCSISLILPIHCPFEKMNIIFTKCLLCLNLFKMKSRTFVTKTFLISSLVFYLWRHFWRDFTILPLICNSITFLKNLTWF